MGGQAHAQLALAVVHQPLAGAAAVQVGHVPARDGANVVGAAVFTRRPRQVVLAVVQLAHDDGAVDVAIDKVHQHFGAGTGCEHRAPVGTRHTLGHTHPGAAAGVTRGMAGGLGADGVGAAQSAVDGGHASLPGELDAHATIAIRGDRIAVGGDHDGSLRAWGHARRCRQRHQAHIGRHGLEVVAVAASLQAVLSDDKVCTLHHPNQFVKYHSLFCLSLFFPFHIFLLSPCLAASPWHL